MLCPMPSASNRSPSRIVPNFPICTPSLFEALTVPCSSFLTTTRGRTRSPTTGPQPFAIGWLNFALMWRSSTERFGAAMNFQVVRNLRFLIHRWWTPSSDLGQDGKTIRRFSSSISTTPIRFTTTPRRNIRNCWKWAGSWDNRA